MQCTKRTFLANTGGTGSTNGIGINMTDITKSTESELFAMHNSVLDELQRRGVVRTQNNPVGDYSEWLVSKVLGLKLAPNSAKGFDATDSEKNRYQIKGRRITKKNKSAQLGVIRGLDDSDFDFLIAVIFDESWKVVRAAKIPHKAISELSKYRKRINGHVMYLRLQELSNPAVENITKLFCDGLGL